MPKSNVRNVFGYVFGVTAVAGAGTGLRTVGTLAELNHRAGAPSRSAELGVVPSPNPKMLMAVPPKLVEAPS